MLSKSITEDDTIDSGKIEFLDRKEEGGTAGRAEISVKFDVVMRGNLTGIILFTAETVKGYG